MIDYHVHLERGPYTFQWLKEFVETGNSCGISEFGIVEHLYMFKEAKGLLFQDEHVKAKQNRNISCFFDFINNAKALNLPVKLGLEVDYVANKEVEIREFVKNLDVDFLIGSVHYLGSWSFDLNPNWQGRAVGEIYHRYFNALLGVVKSGDYDILGHCGNIAYHRHHLSDAEEDKMFISFFEELAKFNIVMEINAGGLYRPAEIVFPKLKYLPLIRELGIEITVSSDAHDPKHTGWKLNDLVLPKIKEAGFNHLVGFDKREKVYYEI